MNIEVKSSVKPIDYLQSIKILEKRVHDVFLGKKDELLWVLEHNSVYTAGTSAKKKDLLDKNLPVIKTNRGGKYTLHSPGQKVVYLIQYSSFFHLNFPKFLRHYPTPIVLKYLQLIRSIRE